MNRIGRITTWPECQPPERRNMRCACYLHGACTSPTKTLANVDPQLLLEWLYIGTFEETQPRARLLELRAQHSQLFKDMFAERS